MPHYDGTYTVGEDGSVTVEEIQTRPDSQGCPGQADLDKQKDQLQHGPESIEPFSEDNRCGYKATWSSIPTSALNPQNPAFPNLFTEASRDGSQLDLTINNKLLQEPSSSTVSWTFVFPGTIETADGGEIDGNRAVWSDMKSAPQTIQIRGQLEAKAKPTENGAEEENGQAAEKDQKDEKDFPWLAVILGGAGGLVVVAAIIVVVVVVRRKRRGPVPQQTGQWGQMQQGQWGAPNQTGQYGVQGQQGHPGQQDYPAQPGQPGQQGQPGQPGQFAPPPPPPGQGQQAPGQQNPGQTPPNQGPPWQGPPPQS